MLYAYWIAVTCFALLGHVVLCVGLMNHVTSRALPKPLLRTASAAAKVWLVAAPAWIVAAVVLFGVDVWPAGGPPYAWAESFYVALCAVVGAAASALWLIGLRGGSSGRALLNSTTRLVRLTPAAPPVDRDTTTRVLLRVPRNEAYEVELVTKTLALPRLDTALAGLNIVHLSDLHFTGRVERNFFDQVIDLCNDLRPDLVALTGDLVDRADCLSWIPAVLGRLRAECGAFFILGNHDLKVDVARLRALLSEAGLTDVGGRWRSCAVRGQTVLVAGNELPWHVPAADPAEQPATECDNPLRILLAHSPDQFAWAQRHGFDLMLAGHTHGGQIRVPGLGAVFSPTRGPLLHTAGVFYAPPTVMHVTRGVSAETPLRLRCRPEAVQLILQPAADATTDRSEPSENRDVVEVLDG